MGYLTYKLLHLLGAFLTLAALGAIVSRVGAPGGRSAADRMAVVLHGFGLLILLVAGFGLLARVGISWPWPAWIWLKLGVWALLGGAVVAVRRARLSRHVALVALPLLAALAAYLAIYKP
jgi:hypothetical protein